MANEEYYDDELEDDVSVSFRVERAQDEGEEVHSNLDIQIEEDENTLVPHADLPNVYGASHLHVSTNVGEMDIEIQEDEDEDGKVATLSNDSA